MALRALAIDTIYSDEELETFSVVMWLPVPEGEQVANPEFETAVPPHLLDNFPPEGVQSALNQLRAGAWREVVERVSVDKRTSAGVLRTPQQRWNAFQESARTRYIFLATSQDARNTIDNISGSYYDDQTDAWVLVQESVV